jgi:2-polyprenyl-3-methyl-5-hydroxy-6-metoxy-1,4-benzoquinol methylase
MTSESFSDATIVESWGINASPWTAAVREGQIDSRTRVTDRAVLDAVLRLKPKSVLDIGCGEGWLSRAVAAQNIKVVGIDVVPQLVEAAKQAGGGDFRVLSYEDLALGRMQLSVDVAVCNFALIGKESVEGLFATIPSLLTDEGAFVVQTLHPLMVCGELPYQDGWRKGSWAGCGKDFINPAPWYFRTMESWTSLFFSNGLRLCELLEPVHPVTQKPASAIFIAAPAK